MKPFTICLILTALWCSQAPAAGVEARLSTREAYVGMPVLLEVSIADASDIKPPTIPDIEGCDIRAGGPPAHSEQVVITNGRRSESSQDTFSFLITPRHTGSFEIPALTMDVDGQRLTTQTLRFVASKSETGDLLFVEIEGGKDQVYVGQPLELTLKIWLKPYRDTDRNLTLSEGQMWQMVSEQSSWGGFADRIQELAESNRRPGGREVLREDSDGNERSYYLYEVDGTIYPTRPGKIDAEDVQIVVHYPTALGKSRSTFDSFFGDDLFGSPFGNRLMVTSSRPIVGEVDVDATEVLAIPSIGRPADYRGAVGQYQIVTQATPTSVDAGEPITLNIGIAGTGPMELVQAPPLDKLPELTGDFKVADESLAGFVKEDTKLFSTTIRPRRDGITAIPPIQFSYFDPDVEEFVTVRSEPISISVRPADTLALDAIVSHSQPNRETGGSPANPTQSVTADFSNLHDPAVLLVSQSPAAEVQAWWLFILLPPALWLILLLYQHRRTIVERWPSVRSAKATCLSAIEHADDDKAVAAAFRKYISQRSGKHCPTNASAVGALRAAGMYDVAGSVESYLQRLDGDAHATTFVYSQTHGKPSTDRAIELIEQLEVKFSNKRRTGVRRSKGDTGSTIKKVPAHRSLGILLAALASLPASHSIAAEPLDLTPSQQETILAEAGVAYGRAVDAADRDSADAKAAFDTAANKYQLLVDSGIHNSQLYLNLANAYLQSGQLGRAIANYEHAKLYNPNDARIRTNLQIANSRVQGDAADTYASADRSTLDSAMWYLRQGNDKVFEWLGERRMIAALTAASLIFWSVQIARTLGRPITIWPWATVPLVVLTVLLASVGLHQFADEPDWNAVVVSDHLELRAGDGEPFETTASMDSTQGYRVEVTDQRSDWLRIRTRDNQMGWIPRHDVVMVVAPVAASS